MSDRIYILCTEDAYRAAESAGEYISDSLASEGFIHASPSHQLNRVANLYYQSFPKLLVLCVNTGRLKPELRWETASTGDLYPHLYGPMNLDAIAQIIPVERALDGRYDVEKVIPA